MSVANPRVTLARGLPTEAASEARRDWRTYLESAPVASDAFMAEVEDAALHYAEIRADLKRRDLLIGANDLFIAAHARAFGLTLVTNNTAEFERVSALTVENWTI